MKATFKIILFSRVTADGKRPVMFRVTHARKSKHFTLSRYCLPGEWDTKACRFKRAFPEYKRENDLLLTLEQRASNILYEWERANVPFNFAAFEKEMFADRQPAGVVVWQYVQGVADTRQQEGREGYSRVIAATANVVKAYDPAARLFDLSPDWLTAFVKWMQGKRNFQAGGIIHTLKTLRIVCNHAVKAGVMPETWTPYKGFKLAHIRAEVKHRAITLQDLRTLKEAPVESEAERFALDVFLFSFYCWGMNFADMANLRPENIRELRIEYRRQKTGRLYSINLSRQAAAILDKYRGGSYLFPIYTDAHTTERQKYVRKKNIRHEVNEALRAIVARLGWKAEGFTLYVSRHTYATALKRAGFAHSLIQDALGHSDAKTTAVYLDKFENAALDSANAAILEMVG